MILIEIRNYGQAHNVLIKKKFTRNSERIAIRYLFHCFLFDSPRLIRKYLNTCVCLLTINKSIKRHIDPDPVGEDTQNPADSDSDSDCDFGSGLVDNLQIALEGPMQTADTNQERASATNEAWQTNTRLLH